GGGEQSPARAARRRRDRDQAPPGAPARRPRRRRVRPDAAAADGPPGHRRGLMADQMTFPDGVLGNHSSVKGFKVIATDGRCGRVSWASYAPGESYLVLTVGRLSRKHHVLPAGAVKSVGDGEVHVALSRSELAELPLLLHPEAVPGDEV